MAYIYDLTDTWNASGTTFNGIKLNVTDSASASSSKLVTLQTNGTEHFSITKAGVGYVSGNLGVGTTSPSSKLSVAAGNIQIESTYGVVLSGSTANGYFIDDGSIGGKIQTGGGFRVFTGGANERMRIAADGTMTLSIGGVSTTHQFNYNESGGEIQLIDSTGAGPILLDNSGGLARFYKVGSGAVSMGTTGANYFQFITNGSERMRIDVNGLVGIGTSSPASLLHAKRGSNATEVYPSGTWTSRIINATDGSGENGLVVGNRWAANTSTVFEAGSIYGGGSGSWYSYYKIDGAGQSFWSQGGTERMRLNSSGFLLVGATSPLGGNTSSEFKVTGAGSWPLTLNANDRGLLVRNSAASSGIYAYFEYNGGTNNGQISWSGGTTSYTTTSDARVKKNIVDAPDAGALIDAIKVRSWDFKVDDMHWRYGMVAQELLSVAPEAVTVPEDEEMMMGVDYAKLVPMLIKEVQSLRARVAQLEGN
jgi:hypothetical protein